MLMIEDFLNYLRYERNRSDLTVSNYERSLCDFEYGVYVTSNRTSKIEKVISLGSR